MKIATGVSLSIALLLCASFGLRSGDRGGVAQAADNITLQGTGATFPAPLYQKWFREYNQLHPKVQINYQALGSGAGIKQFQQGLVNFGASDAAMTDEEMAAVKAGVVLLPMTAGSIVLAYNLPDVTESEALPRGLHRNFSRQDHPMERPGHRQGQSGRETARHQDHGGQPIRRQRHHLRLHLSSVARSARHGRAGPGAGKTVNFPVGVAGKGNPGVTALIKQTPGAIGYVEYRLCRSRPRCRWRNWRTQAGKFVKADLESGKGCARRRRVARQPARLDSRSRGRQRLSDRHLHLAAVLQEV